MTDLRKAIEEILETIYASLDILPNQSTNTPQIKGVEVKGVEEATDDILALLSQERAALLDAIESQLPEKGELKGWLISGDKMIAKPEELKFLNKGRNHALDQVTKLLAEMRGEL